MHSRREFLRMGAMASAGACFGGCVSQKCVSGAIAVKGLRIGVQMWSVDKLWKKNPAAAFRRLKSMGCDGVQSIGFFSMDHGELEKMLGDSDLRIVDMPFRMNMVGPDGFNKYLEFCKRFSVDFVYEPWAEFSTGAEWRRHAERLIELSAKFAEYGIRVGYHNHQHELRQHFGGKTPMEYLYDAGLDMELDVGHVKLAKRNPVSWIEKLKGRVPTIHAKPGGGRSVGGAGDANDWPGIFSAAAAAGTKWAVVECETCRDTYEDVAASMDFIGNMAKG